MNASEPIVTNVDPVFANVFIAARLLLYGVDRVEGVSVCFSTAVETDAILLLVKL